MNLNILFSYDAPASFIQFPTAFCPQASASLGWVISDRRHTRFKNISSTSTNFSCSLSSFSYFPCDPPYVTDDLREAEAYQASKDKLQTELELLQRQMQNSVPFYSTRYKVIAFIRSLQHC